MADDSNFIRESSKRNTIFKDMFLSGEAYMEDGRGYNLDTLYSHVQQFPKMTGGTRGVIESRGSMIHMRTSELDIIILFKVKLRFFAAQ